LHRGEDFLRVAQQRFVVVFLWHVHARQKRGECALPLQRPSPNQGNNTHHGNEQHHCKRRVDFHGA
jgi:hypothetical protein